MIKFVLTKIRGSFKAKKVIVKSLLVFDFLCRYLLLLKITVKPNPSMTMCLPSPSLTVMFGFGTTRWSIAPFLSAWIFVWMSFNFFHAIKRSCLSTIWTFELLWQISVPHNEIDKVDKGGLDKMTLIEVLATSFYLDTLHAI